MEAFIQQFTESLWSIQDLTGTFSVMDITIGMLLSFVLTAILWWIYKKTHKGTSYTQNYGLLANYILNKVNTTKVAQPYAGQNQILGYSYTMPTTSK